MLHFGPKWTIDHHPELEQRDTATPSHRKNAEALRRNEHLQAAGLQSQPTHMPERVKGGPQ